MSILTKNTIQTVVAKVATHICAVPKMRALLSGENIAVDKTATPSKSDALESVGEALRGGALGGTLCGGAVGVALSGGADSVALLSVLLRLGYPVVALHCNFHLRGEESDRDRRFAENLCRQLGVEILVTDVDTRARMAATGESLELAARNLRYDWFAQMAKRVPLRCVAIAHHSDDNAETFFLNALRGTGIAGLTGIPAVRDIYVRPLLCLSRREILDYLAAEGLDYVTDSSNLECDASRNKLRNRCFPVLDESFPDFRRQIQTTIDNLGADSRLLEALLAEKRRRYILPDGSIDLAALQTDEHEPLALLFHLLDKQISPDRLSLLLANSSSSGKIYESPTTRWLLDRGRLIPLHHSATATGEISLPLPNAGATSECASPTLLTLPDGQRIEISIISREEFSPRRDFNYAWFDLDALRRLAQKPDGGIRFRHPRTADRMRPFGMRGTRLVSDILTEQKLSIIAKAETWLLEAGGNILWITGIKTGTGATVSASTGTILQLRLIN